MTTTASPSDLSAASLQARRDERRSRFLNAVPVIAAALDLIVVLAAVLLANEVRRAAVPWVGTWLLPYHARIAAPIIVVSWMAFSWMFGAYKRSNLGAGTEEYKQVLHAAVYTAGALGIVSYMTKWELSRLFFATAFALAVVGVLAERFAFRRLLYYLRRRGHLLQKVLIVGAPHYIDELAAVLNREQWIGYQVIGAVANQVPVGSRTDSGVEIVAAATVDDIVEHARHADVIIFGSGTELTAFDRRRVFWAIEDHKVAIVVAPGITDVSADRVKSRSLGGVPLLYVTPPTWSASRSSGKRIFDIAGSALLIVAISPLLLATAIAIKAGDGGPVFFKQTRVGRNGELFTCLKFRSMVVDAEARLAELKARGSDLHGTSGDLYFKLRDDPRVTRIGRFLRRYSIDEFPQLFNVFAGQMSLVGPRPQLVREVRLYEDWMHRRLNLRPGMTGLWQTSGRSDLSPEEAIRLDLYYVDNWSTWQDLLILLRTVRAVFGSRGAY